MSDEAPEKPKLKRRKKPTRPKREVVYGSIFVALGVGLVAGLIGGFLASGVAPKLFPEIFRRTTMMLAAAIGIGFGLSAVFLFKSNLYRVLGALLAPALGILGAMILVDAGETMPAILTAIGAPCVVTGLLGGMAKRSTKGLIFGLLGGVAAGVCAFFAMLALDRTGLSPSIKFPCFTVAIVCTAQLVIGIALGMVVDPIAEENSEDQAIEPVADQV